MKIDNASTDSMTYEEVDELLQKLRSIRKRKSEARDCKRNLDARITSAKEQGFIYINVYSGEVLNAEDWVVFDESSNRTYDGFFVKA